MVTTEKLKKVTQIYKHLYVTRNVLKKKLYVGETEKVCIIHICALFCLFSYLK